MSSIAPRRRKKMNSDNDSLKVLDFDSPAEVGPVPYDDFYDYGPNGIHYIIGCLDFVDNNYFDEESGDYFDVYKL